MAQAKVNRELTSFGADLTSINVHKGYLTCSKSKVHYTLQDTEENSVLPPQEQYHNDNKDVLAGAATAFNLLSPPTENFNSQHLNQSHMKCYYSHTHGSFLDYFNDPF